MAVFRGKTMSRMYRNIPPVKQKSFSFKNRIPREHCASINRYILTYNIDTYNIDIYNRYILMSSDA